MTVSSVVRERYEHFPYPPVPWLALPRRGQGESLRFENGAAMAGRSVSHEGIRILVAGAGTLEALVVAQAHPRAREVVAVDLSERSVRELERRVRTARVLRPLSHVAPLRAVCADLLAWEPSEKFDYILASNVIHHVEDPTALLARLSSWLKPGGFLRLVTYPRQSRIWMRLASRWFAERGLTDETPGLVSAARRAVAELAVGDPVRSCFESQPETGRVAGLVDAFFHPCENPLSPLEWEKACASSGLTLRGEAQTETSQSSFLDEVVPSARGLSRWQKLQVLDDLLELCANPILWLEKTEERETQNVSIERAPAPADWRDELIAGVRRAEKLLAPHATLPQVFESLRRETGPRPQPGLSVIDYEKLFFGR